MDYKRIIKNKEIRFKILRLLRIIPDRVMIKLQYRIKLARKPNIDNPKRYTEKLQWYKLNYRNELMTQCSDKYAVRKYIASKGLEGILNKLYGVYNSVDDVMVESLPNKFVIKTTNGSGTNYFCSDKTQFDFSLIQNDLRIWLSRDIYSSGREWSYKNIRPRIIVEEFLEEHNSKFQGINDYKFICFNGEPKYIVLDVERHVKHKRNIYDLEWNYIDVSTDHSNIGNILEKPEGLDQMIKVASKIAKDFPCVRVDLYWVNKKVYFGEITFYPWSGYVQFTPDEFDFTLGEKFELPKIMK